MMTETWRREDASDGADSEAIGGLEGGAGSGLQRVASTQCAAEGVDAGFITYQHEDGPLASDLVLTAVDQLQRRVDGVEGGDGDSDGGRRGFALADAHLTGPGHE